MSAWHEYGQALWRGWGGEVCLCLKISPNVAARWEESPPAKGPRCTVKICGRQASAISAHTSRSVGLGAEATAGLGPTCRAQPRGRAGTHR